MAILVGMLLQITIIVEVEVVMYIRIEPKEILVSNSNKIITITIMGEGFNKISIE
jgi:hypothetical protein